MNINLIPANTPKQFSQIEALYMDAFPIEERKPFPLIIDKSKEGFIDILSIETDSTGFIGEAILAKNKDIALLDYFAISPKMRGNGSGSRTLELLQSRYHNYRFLLEIESTCHPVPDLAQRLRRKEFYLRNGMACMDYLVFLFGVEMEILTNGCTISFAEYLAFYENIYGSRITGQIKLIQQEADAINYS